MKTQPWIQNLKFLCVVLCAGTPLVFAASCSAQDDRPVTSDNPAATAAMPASETKAYGIVTDTNGLPLAEAGIAVTQGTAPVGEKLVLSDDNGNYIWSLPAGRFTLSANKDGYQSQSREVQVKENESVKLDFMLKKLP